MQIAGVRADLKPEIEYDVVYGVLNEGITSTDPGRSTVPRSTSS
jgi:hypothetical protein